MPFDTDKLGLIEGLFDNFQNLGRKKTTTPSRDEQTKKKPVEFVRGTKL